MLKKTLCLLLALALLSAPAAQAVKWDYPVSAHPAVDYADMLPVEDFDETALLSALKELEGLCSRKYLTVIRMSVRLSWQQTILRRQLLFINQWALVSFLNLAAAVL